MKKIKKGFTLAEVLITLGIIGIVAALTIPSLVNQYKKKALESQFKEGYAILTNAVAKMMYDNDITSLKDYPPFKGNGDVIAGSSIEFMKALTPNIKGAAKIGYDGNDNERDTRKNLYTFDNQIALANPAHYAGWLEINSNNGMIINAGTIGNAYIQTCVYLDTNGNSGPNKLGYDLFMFYVGNSTTKLEPGIVNPDYFGGGLGADYAKYALIDKCPTDDTKKYWECLP